MHRVGPEAATGSHGIFGAANSSTCDDFLLPVISFFCSFSNKNPLNKANKLISLRYILSQMAVLYEVAHSAR